MISKIDKLHSIEKRLGQSLHTQQAIEKTIFPIIFFEIVVINDLNIIVLTSCDNSYFRKVITRLPKLVYITVTYHHQQKKRKSFCWTMVHVLWLFYMTFYR